MTTKNDGDGARIMKATEFRARCLQLMDEVAHSGEEIVITKRGKPVSRLVPYQQPVNSNAGGLKTRVRILGDIVSPMPAEWFTDPDDSKDPLN